MKITALFFILIAGIFMLAHAVVPHSHHDGTLCLSLEKAIPTQECSHEHDESCSPHQGEKKHHHHGKSENCDLKDVLLRQDNQPDRPIPYPDSLTLFFIASFNQSYIDSFLQETNFTQKPYLNTYQSIFSGYSSSLRAPPMS